ncbi:MAG: DHH family phosphoesterase [Sulfuricurvum sp.]|nr:DHH family phosphoesterase [Sulfuricurvum sp.]
MPLSLIDSARHIILIIHKDPDADSMGSACAFYSYLLRSQKKLTLFCASETLNPDLAFLPWFDKITNRFPEEGDCMISFDCGSNERFGIESSLPLINFDHHKSNVLYGLYNIVDVNAISTTQVVYDFFVANSIKINGKMALSLYAGLLDDSKCFSAFRCDVTTFATAQALLGFGADHALCVEWLYNRRSLASMRLRGTLFREMKILLDGQLAFFDVQLSHLEDSGATIPECKLILEEALRMYTVKAGLMKIDHPYGGAKLSLRTDGSIDASKIMAPFNGGGHINRAGAQLKNDERQSAVDEIILMIKKEFV